MDWLLHATRLTQPELRVLYDVYCNAPADERVLEHLAGYGRSRPVRIGQCGGRTAATRRAPAYGVVIGSFYATP